MKKTIALLLTVAFLFTFAFSGFGDEAETEINNESTTAEENNSEDIIQSPPENGNESDENDTDNEVTDDGVSEDITEEEPVVRMWICSSYLGYFPSGHTWLYFENLTQETVLIGIYELQPESGVSVGTFCNQLKGFGVYYNIETHKGTPFDTHSLCTDLTAEELVTVSDSIINHNYWGLVHNCVFFATRVWKTVAETKAVYTFYPLFSMADIRAKDGEIGTLEMIKTTKDEVFRLKEVDGELTLICCNDYLKDK